MPLTSQNELRAQCKELVEKFQTRTFLVVGDLILDVYLEGKALGIANEAPVPLLEIQQITRQPGGAANVAANLAALQAKTMLTGGLGRDEAGLALEQALRPFHLELRPVYWERETIEKTRILSGQQYYLRLDQEDSTPLSDLVNHALMQIIRESAPPVDAIIISDYAKGIVNPGMAKAVEKLACAIQKPILADIKPAHVPLWRRLSLVTPNRSEALSMLNLWGDEVPAEIASGDLASLLQEKLQCPLILKLSEEGLIAVDQEGTLTAFPALCSAPANTTGAGDTVLAVAAAALTCGAPLRQAAWLANLAASLAVTHASTYPVTIKELQEALK
jgi:rfaE bifunctional protein kinase chain/domain